VIVVRLIGGLGNQLFQYAIARRLAEDTGQPFKLDVRAYEYDTLRRYSLSAFNVREEIATAADIRRVKPSVQDAGRHGGPSLLWNYLRYSRTWIQERTPYTYDPSIVRPRRDVYLEGYWNHEGYFKSIEPIIRREFTVRTPPAGLNLELAREMARGASVAVHVRRGDYASNPETGKFHGLAPLSYYERAVARLTTTVREPNFFVFSDDPEWTREHLRLGASTTYVTHNPPEKDYEDLRLMAACRHHIIANSSFSWWGAWLAERRSDQVVIAPEKWLNEPSIDTRGVTPPGWIRL
jgi:hypothetical protein